jgi:3-deoxy-D-manno-octulosonic-acid transferase
MPSSAAELRLLRIVWTTAVVLLAPVALLWLAWRAWRQVGGLDPTGERLGAFAPCTDRPLWFHAASVGEVNALLPIVRALDQRQPGVPIHVTTFTATGARRAREALGARATVGAVPLDLPWCARRALAALRPRALIVIETELWPNLLAECARAGVPFAFVSARLTERAARRLEPFQPVFEAALAPAVAVGVQSGADALRFRALGAPGAVTRIVGNVKWDLATDPGLAARGAALKRDLLGGRLALVAGSTREGEEALVLAAFAALRDAHPTLALVLAPRHPERAEAAVAAATAAGFASVRRSSGQALGDAAVMVVDALGELMPFYAAADVAFVGGSLVPVGGHNLLEPAALGVPVLAGPHQHNAPDVAERLRDAGGLRLVDDAAALVAAAGELLADPGARATMGGRARGAVHANKGALEHCLAIVLPLAAR